MQVLGNFLTGRDNVTHVGVLGLAQGGGHADVDGIEIEERGKVGRGAQLSGFHQRPKRGIGDIPYIGISGVHAVDLVFVVVDSRDGEAGLGELHSERQAHISEPHDSDASAARTELLFEKPRGGFRHIFYLLHDRLFSQKKLAFRDQDGGAGQVNALRQAHIERSGRGVYAHRRFDQATRHSHKSRAGRPGTGAHGFARASLPESHIDGVFVHGLDEGNVGAIGEVRVPLRSRRPWRASRNRNRSPGRRIGGFPPTAG